MFLGFLGFLGNFSTSWRGPRKLGTPNAILVGPVKVTYFTWLAIYLAGYLLDIGILACDNGDAGGFCTPDMGGGDAFFPLKRRFNFPHTKV
jgi:hypothetical protein